MYCQKCGNQMPDNARFCSKCGFAVPAAKAAEQPATPTAETTTANGNPFAAPKEKKPIPAKAIGVAAVAVVVILAAVLIIPMLGGGSTLDLKQAYTVSMQGVEGYGAVRLTENEEYLTNWLCESIGLDPAKVDLDELDPFSALGYYSFSDGMDVEGYTEKVFGKAMTEEELEAMWEELELIVTAFYDLDYEVTPDADLKNGDKVEIAFTYDEADLKEAGIKLKNTAWTHTVEGLTGVATVDIFAAITVNMEGYDGYGRLTFAADENQFKGLGLTEDQQDAISYYVDVECTDREGLSNGDKVVFNVNANEEQLARSAVLIEPTRWEYEVSGLEEVELIDPFEGLKLTCTGISPYLTVNLDTSACDNRVQQAVTFTLPEGYARNGVPVTVTASIEDDLVERYGFGLSSESKDIALSTQSEYVTSLEGLNLTALLQEMEDTKLAKSSSNGYTNVTQQGSAFLYLKEHNENKKRSNTPYNQYIILYEGTDLWDTYYGFAVRAWNLCKHPDGTFTYDTDIKWNRSNGGYDSAYKDYIDGNRENYVVTNLP